jgi:hypothetical protein
MNRVDVNRFPTDFHHTETPNGIRWRSPKNVTHAPWAEVDVGLIIAWNIIAVGNPPDEP